MIKIVVESVREPRWSSEDQSTIDCWVKTNTLAKEMPFTASRFDPESHGREIYERCLGGEFGEIAPMEPREAIHVPSCVEMPLVYKQLERFLVEANREVSRGSYRGVAIVWASMLDNVLDRVLEADVASTPREARKLKKLPQTLDKRIRAALERGLLDQEEAEKCHHIRCVRNQAAHHWELKLESKDVLPSLRALYDADHSNILVFHEDLDFLLQQVYAGSCAMLVMRLMARMG